MNSVEALDFAIRRVTANRGRFVHTEAHNECLATLIALREVLVEHAAKSTDAEDSDRG